MKIRNDVYNILNTSDWKNSTEIYAELREVYTNRPYTGLSRLVAFFSKSFADMLRDPSISGIYVSLDMLERGGLIESRQRHDGEHNRIQWRRKISGRKVPEQEQARVSALA